jgi:pimeloyl-ACP methyl ester carboxylesterase
MQMTRPADQFVNVLGHNTRYWKLGNQGSPIVLIHGISCSVLEWEHVIDELSEQHQVFALDLLGHGLTDKPLDATYDIADLSKFTLAFMDAVSLKTASLVGNSLGGRIAIECAAVASHRVTAVVLSAPAAVRNPTLLEFRLGSIPFLGEILTAPSQFGTGKIWRSAFADPKYATKTMVAEKVVFAKLPGAGKAFLKCLRDMLGLGGFKSEVLADTHEKIKRIKAPTIVIWGRQDKFLPISHLSTFLELMPTAESVIMERCGHVPMIEFPKEFSQLVLSFLRKKSALISLIKSPAPESHAPQPQ